MNKHQHPCYEIVFYIDGEGESIINNTTYKFKPNTFTICRPNTFHKEVGYSKVELIYIGFDVLNDNFKIQEMPDCPAPIRTSVNVQANATNAIVTWVDNNPDHEAWNVYYRIANSEEEVEWQEESATEQIVEQEMKIQTKHIQLHLQQHQLL